MMGGRGIFRCFSLTMMVDLFWYYSAMFACLRWKNSCSIKGLSQFMVCTEACQYSFEVLEGG